MENARNKAENGLRKKPRTKVAMRTEIRQLHRKGMSGPDIETWLANKYGKRSVPSLRTIQRIVQDWENPKTPETRAAKARLKALDQEWTVATLSEYELNPLAVAKIFELKAKGLKFLSIRMAQWISRLVALPLSTDMLCLVAFVYGANEEARELGWESVDTTDSDKKIDNMLLAKLQDHKTAQVALQRWDEDFHLNKLFASIPTEMADLSTMEFFKSFSEYGTTTEGTKKQDVKP